MRIAVLKAARAAVLTVFALLAAMLIGLSIYAVLQFGLWWPVLFGWTGSTRMILAALTLLPFLLLFTRLNWSRPVNWLAVRLNRLVEPIDRAIARAEH